MHEENKNYNCIITGNREVLQQGTALLLSLTDEQYTTNIETYACSSIGQHFRHILDMYQAVLPALASAQPERGITMVVDYDNRRRGASVETQRQSAIDELYSIRQHIDRRVAPLCLPIDVKTEVCIESTQYSLIPSNLARELAFISSHAIHHFALIKVIAKMLGADIDETVGLAPASATFERTQQLAPTAIAS